MSRGIYITKFITAMFIFYPYFDRTLTEIKGIIQHEFSLFDPNCCIFGMTYTHIGGAWKEAQVDCVIRESSPWRRGTSMCVGSNTNVCTDSYIRQLQVLCKLQHSLANTFRHHCHGSMLTTEQNQISERMEKGNMSSQATPKWRRK